jgi:hypothetical protein
MVFSLSRELRSDDLGGLPGVDGGIVLDGLSYAPEEYVGGAGADPLEPGSEGLDDAVVVVGLVDGVEPALEAAVLLGDALELPGVVDGGDYLLLVADDALVLGEASDVLCAVGCDLGCVKLVECFLEVGPNMQRVRFWKYSASVDGLRPL